MNLCTSVFVYVGSIGLYKRIVNAYTQSIRIANADGQGEVAVRPEEFETFACVFSQTPSPVRVLPLIQEGELFSLLFNMLLKLLLLDKRRWPSGRRSLKLLLACPVKLPPPFGYSLPLMP